jgi:hypothetical protein
MRSHRKLGEMSVTKTRASPERRKLWQASDKFYAIPQDLSVPLLEDPAGSLTRIRLDPSFFGPLNPHLEVRRLRQAHERLIEAAECYIASLQRDEKADLQPTNKR